MLAVQLQGAAPSWAFYIYRVEKPSSLGWGRWERGGQPAVSTGDGRYKGAQATSESLRLLEKDGLLCNPFLTPLPREGAARRKNSSPDIKYADILILDLVVSRNVKNTFFFIIYEQPIQWYLVKAAGIDQAMFSPSERLPHMRPGPLNVESKSARRALERGRLALVGQRRRGRHAPPKPNRFVINDCTRPVLFKSQVQVLG